MVIRNGDGRRGNWMKVVKLPIIGQISIRDMTYNMITIINIAIWHI